MIVCFAVVDPPVIEYIEYVADNMNPALNKDAQSPSQEKDKGGDAKRDERPSIGVTMRYVCVYMSYVKAECDVTQEIVKHAERKVSTSKSVFAAIDNLLYPIL